MGKLYTTETLSEYMQVSPRTIRRERNDGRLSFVVIRGQIRYREEDVERYLVGNESVENDQLTQSKAV
jgi:excisionase family DNA binding protein